jgi:hypothetical protein
MTAAAAKEKIVNPEQWVMVNAWNLSASPGWDAKWDSAGVGLTVNGNPDLGARTDVISDADILSAVQVLKPVP